MGPIRPGRAFRSSFAVALAASALLAAPAPGLAGTTAQHPTDGGTPVSCSPNTGYVQSWSGGDLADLVRLGAVITQWQFQAGTGGGTVALQTLRHNGVSNDYTADGESAIETLTPSTLNTFNTRIPVPHDDQFGITRLGLRIVTGNPECRYSGFQYDEVSEASPAPVVGSGPTTYGPAQVGFRLNLQVVVEDDDDGDGFGDETQDGCPGRAERQDDCVKPIVTMDKGKPRKRKATFAFSSNEPGTFECHLENKKFRPCTSPVKLKKLKPGRHNFTVRAVDANNNKSGQTSFAWNVKKKRPKKG